MHCKGNTFFARFQANRHRAVSQNNLSFLSFRKKDKSPDSDSVFGSKVELISGGDIEEIVPVIGIRHNTVSALAPK